VSAQSSIAQTIGFAAIRRISRPEKEAVAKVCCFCPEHGNRLFATTFYDNLKTMSEGIIGWILN
jgi:hypothetical protein